MLRSKRCVFVSVVPVCSCAPRRQQLGLLPAPQARLFLDALRLEERAGGLGDPWGAAPLALNLLSRWAVLLRRTARARGEEESITRARCTHLKHVCTARRLGRVRAPAACSYAAVGTFLLVSWRWREGELWAHPCRSLPPCCTSPARPMHLAAPRCAPTPGRTPERRGRAPISERPSPLLWCAPGSPHLASAIPASTFCYRYRYQWNALRHQRASHRRPATL